MCREVRPLSQLKGMGVSANIRPNGARVSAPCTVGVFFVPSMCDRIDDIQRIVPLSLRSSAYRSKAERKPFDEEEGGMVSRGSGRGGESGEAVTVFSVARRRPWRASRRS